MEALALLCTLHADGPATLRRLHRAGCHSLQRLEQYAPDELAEILELPPAVARRLGREAKSLADRLDLSPAGDPSTTAYGLGDHEEAPEITTPSGPEALEPRTPLSSALDRRDRVVLDRVLERWRSAPAGDGDAQVGDADRTVSRTRPAAEAREPEVVPALPSIPVGAIDGLDADVSAHLAQLGVSDLGTLAATEPGLLARALGLSYARVRRLQFLAGRAQPMARVAPVAPAAPVARTAPAPPRPSAEPALPVAVRPPAERALAPPTGVPAPAEAPVPTFGRSESVPRVEVPAPQVEPPARVQASAPQRVAGSNPAPGTTAASPVPTPPAARPAATEPPTYQAPILVHDEPPRRKFWEPRIQRAAARAAAAQTPLGTTSREQGPAQGSEQGPEQGPEQGRNPGPARTPEARPMVQAAPVPPPAPVPTSTARSEPAPRAPRRGVTLHWNFELHPPPGTARAAAPLPEPSWSAATSALPQRDAERDRDLGDEGAAGPFA